MFNFYHQTQVTWLRRVMGTSTNWYELVRTDTNLYDPRFPAGMCKWRNMFGLFKATRGLEFVHRPVFKKHRDV